MVRVLPQVLAAAEGTSKVPFYVAGGLLVAWAVVLAAIGLSRPHFPDSPVAGRGVLAITLLLVATVMTAAVLTASRPAAESRAAEPGARKPAPAAPGGALALAADPAGDLAYDSKKLRAAAGRVTIDLANRSPVPHNVTLERDGRTVAASRTVTGASTSVSATLRSGAYTFYCSVDDHRQGGMEGTLTVR